MIAPRTLALSRLLFARAAPKSIFRAVATYSTRALDALLPSMEGAIGCAAASHFASGPGAISVIKEGFLAAPRLRAGDQHGHNGHKS